MVPIVICLVLSQFDSGDKYFDFDLEGFKRIKKEDFVGNSHKKITLEIYRRV